MFQMLLERIWPKSTPTHSRWRHNCLRILTATTNTVPSQAILPRGLPLRLTKCIPSQRHTHRDQPVGIQLRKSLDSQLVQAVTLPLPHEGPVRLERQQGPEPTRLQPPTADPSLRLGIETIPMPEVKELLRARILTQSIQDLSLEALTVAVAQPMHPLRMPPLQLSRDQTVVVIQSLNTEIPPLP